MELAELITQLNLALEIALSGEGEPLAAQLDYIRDGSYELAERHAAYFVRSACAFIEHVPAALNQEAASQIALVSIQRIDEAVNVASLSGQAA